MAPEELESENEEDEVICCHGCGNELDPEETRYIDGNVYCCDCSIICEDCDEAATEWRGVSNRYVCDACIDDHYARCVSCGDYVHNDNSCYCEECDDTYCEGCYSEHSHNSSDSDRLHGHDYKPNPHFFPEKKKGALFLGVELEVNCCPRIKDLIDDLEGYDGHIYLKEDGSLTEGKSLEIVSHPATLEYHVDKFPWEKILKACKENKAKSHDAGNCGLHIHLSRDYFNGCSQEMQDLQVAKILFAFERFWNELLRFSRRGSNLHYCMKTDTNGKKRPVEVLADAYDKGRYYAVNIENSNTIEIRLWRGTLHLSTFYATLEFTDRLIRVLKSLSIVQLQKLQWTDLVKLMLQEKTKYLKSYLLGKTLMSESSDEKEG